MSRCPCQRNASGGPVACQTSRAQASVLRQQIADSHLGATEVDVQLLHVQDVLEHPEELGVRRTSITPPVLSVR